MKILDTTVQARLACIATLSWRERQPQFVGIAEPKTSGARLAQEQQHKGDALVIHKQFSNRQYRFDACVLDYRLISMHRLDSYSRMHGEPVQINVGKPGVRVRLTTEPNSALKAVDQERSFREIRFSEDETYASTTEAWNAILARASGYAQERSSAAEKSQSKGVSNVYLSIEIDGQVEACATDNAWDLDHFIIATGVVDIESIRKRHAHDVAQVIAALSIALAEQAQFVVVIADTVTFALGGTPVFHQTLPRPITNLRAVGALPASKVMAISSIAQRMSQSPEWETPLQLLADAMRRTHDELECFILAYASIEMMIAKLTSGCGTGDWIEQVPAEHRSTAVDLHKLIATRERPARKRPAYAFSEKLTAIRLMYGLGEDVAQQLASIKADVREPLFHKGNFPQQLPVETTLRSAAELLRAVLGH